MNLTPWFLIIGGLFIFMGLTSSMVARLPLTSSIVYLVVGVALGGGGAGLLEVDAYDQAAFVERFTELAVIVSLFSAGLKLRRPLSLAAWAVPLRLAFVSMAMTIGLVAWAATALLGLPLGAGILLGAIVAPTDPVLASDVQVRHPRDRDRLRFALTGEAGFNDGAAFPFVMLGLGLLGERHLGANGWRWILVDLAWAITAGLVVGAVCGTLLARAVLYVRRKQHEVAGLDDFLAMGLIGTSYGLALLVNAYGFLAVFAAGLALGRTGRESRQVTADSSPESSATAVGPRAINASPAPASMAEAVLTFNEKLEHVAEVAVVLLVGAMLSRDHLSWKGAALVGLLFFVIRPVSVYVGLTGAGVSAAQKGLMAWFGIRGIGSIYYLSYASGRGLPRSVADELVSLVLCVVAASILAHGISVTPMMNAYRRTRIGKRAARRSKVRAGQTRGFDGMGLNAGDEAGYTERVRGR